MLFEWDSSKAATNKRKHRVSFELAQLAMETDRTQLSRYDRTVDADTTEQSMMRTAGTRLQASRM